MLKNTNQRAIFLKNQDFTKINAFYWKGKKKSLKIPKITLKKNNGASNSIANNNKSKTNNDNYNNSNSWMKAKN